MKERRNIFGRKYTKFGYILHLLLSVCGFTSFIAILALASLSDMGGELHVEALIASAVIFSLSVAIHNVIFK